MNKLKQNDLVVVLAGKDKGKTGEITRILDNDRVFRVWHQYDQAAHKR